jgi:hypothetical protein
VGAAALDARTQPRGVPLFWLAHLLDDDDALAGVLFLKKRGLR